MDNSLETLWLLEGSLMSFRRVSFSAFATGGLCLAVACGHAIEVANANTGLTAQPNGLVWTTNKLGEIRLAWQSTDPGTGPVTYRVFRNAKEIARTEASTYIDNDILPGDTYEYRVERVDGNGSTSPPSGELIVTSLRSDSAVFVGVGDIAYDGPSDEETAKLIDEAVRKSPDAVVFTTGDNAYPSGTEEEFMNFFEPTWGRHKQRMKPVPGNHDYRTDQGGPYYRYFGAAAGEAGKGYYSYDLGQWHMVALNSEIDISEGSPQIEWLRKDLSENVKTCTLAYFHEPRFNSGKSESEILQTDTIWSALYEHGVDVILNGHQHSYERFGPQRPDGAADMVHGIRQFVMGTGGVSLYEFLNPLPNSLARNNTAYGVVKFTLHPSSYQWEFIPVEGSTYADSGRENCSLTKPPTPPRRFERTLSDSADDAMETVGAGTVDITSSGIYLGAYGNGAPQINGIRFQAIKIPKGTKILSASVRFAPRDTGAKLTQVVITGEAADDSAAFSDNARDISTRPKTIASVAWNIPPWRDGAASQDQVTPSLATIVQEIVNRPGWTSSNDMSFIVEGMGSRVARSFDYDPLDAPVLRIEFQLPSQ